MRDILLTLLVAGVLPLVVLRPFVGLLMLVWLSCFRPQDLAWTFARELPFAVVVGVATLVGIVIGRRYGPPFSIVERPLRFDRLTLWLVLLWVVIALSAITAIRTELGRGPLAETTGAILLAMLVSGLCTNRERFRGLVLVVSLTMSLLALKHLFYFARTGAVPIPRGRAGMTVSGSDLALGILLSAPLLIDAAIGSTRRWTKAALVGLVLAGVVGVVVLLPLSKVDRVAARGLSWRKALSMAAERPVLGVGPGNFEAVWHDFDPPTDRAATSPRNAYLEVFAETGLTGLFAYLGVIVSAIVMLIGLIREHRFDPEERWRVRHAFALLAILIGFSLGSMALGRAHFLLLYVAIGATSAIPVAVDARARVEEVLG